MAKWTKGQKVGTGLGIAAAIGSAAVAIGRAAAAPKIKLSNLSISPETVYPGEDVAISAIAANRANTTLSRTVNLKVNGEHFATADVSLGPGLVGVVNFMVRPTETGIYVITLDGLRGTFICTSQPHAVFELLNPVIEPADPNKGDYVTFHVTVRNIGDAYGEKTFECKFTHG